MYTINNTIERLSLNISGIFGLFDKIGITFPIEWQEEDRSREIKYGKIYNFLFSTTPNKYNSSNFSSNLSASPSSYNGSNSPIVPSASSPIHKMVSYSSSDNIPVQGAFSASSTIQSFSLSNSTDKQKKSKGISFFQKRTSVPNLLSPLMLEPDENFRKLVLSTPGLPHILRRQFWFSVSGGFKLSLQFSDAWEQACQSAALAEGETNLPLTDIDEFDAFLGGRIDILTFLPPAIQLQVSTFLHVFSHAQCGTVEFAPMISTAAALLLLYLEPSLAYLSLTSMVNRSKTENGYFFILSRESLLAESSVFRLLCEKMVKNVVRHADSINVNMEAIHLVCAPMFFFPFIPLQSALTLFDIFMIEGRKFIFQFSLALLQSEERNLLQAMDANSFVEVIVNALERLADVEVLKSFIVKNVEKVDIGKWRRIIALEESYMDPKNKKMMPFVMREDDPALVSFEHKIEVDHIPPEEDVVDDYDSPPLSNNINNNNIEECNSIEVDENDEDDDDDDREVGDIDINLDFVNNQVSSKNREEAPLIGLNMVNDSNNNNSNNNSFGYDTNNLEKKPSGSSFNKETDFLLSSSSSPLDTPRMKGKRSGRIRASSSSTTATRIIHYTPKSLETSSLKRNLIPSSNDGIESAQKMMANTIKQSLPKIHGGRLLDVNLFYMIRSRLNPVYHRFSCQLVFAKSLNGGSLENLISTTMMSYAPSNSSTSSVLSSNSSFMFSSSNTNIGLNGSGLGVKGSAFTFTDTELGNNNNNNNGGGNGSGGYYQSNLPHILVIETLSGKRFGALLSDPLRFDSENNFYGRPMTLVFDAIDFQIYQRFPCPNSMFIKSSSSMLSIGGEMPAIKLPADLSCVESYSCETFGSPSLISGEDGGSIDNVVEVEVYRLKNMTRRTDNTKYPAKTV